MKVKSEVNQKENQEGVFLGSMPLPYEINLVNKDGRKIPNFIIDAGEKNLTIPKTIRELNLDNKTRVSLREPIKLRGFKRGRRFITKEAQPTLTPTPYTKNPILMKCRLCGHTILSPNPINVIVKAQRHYRYAHQIDLIIDREITYPKILEIQKEFAINVLNTHQKVNRGVKEWAENFINEFFELTQKALFRKIIKQLSKYYKIKLLTIKDYLVIKYCLIKNRPRTNYILQANRHPQLLAIIEEKRTKRGQIRHKLLKTIIVASNRKLF